MGEAGDLHQDETVLVSREQLDMECMADTASPVDWRYVGHGELKIRI